MPGVTIASRMGIINCITIVDSQRQHFKTITSFGGLGEIVINTGLSVSCTMPSVTIASRMGIINCITIINGKVQDL